MNTRNTPEASLPIHAFDVPGSDEIARVAPSVGSGEFPLTRPREWPNPRLAIRPGGNVTAFEHIILLLSFIYALALTHLLSSTAALIRAGSRVRFSWLHAGWMANALIVIVANWISFFGLKNAPVWNVATIVFVLAMAVTNYLQAALVCIEVPEEGLVDMVAFHETQARRYTSAVIASLIMGLVANIVFGGIFNISEYVRQNLVVGPMLVAAIVATIWTKGRMNAIALIAILILWGIYFTELQSSLS